jgi:hypothetical protein
MDEYVNGRLLAGFATNTFVLLCVIIDMELDYLSSSADMSGTLPSNSSSFTNKISQPLTIKNSFYNPRSLAVLYDPLDEGSVIDNTSPYAR